MATGKIDTDISTYWKSSEIWQVEVENEAICQYLYNLCIIGTLKSSWLRENVQIASKDIANGPRMAVL